MSHAERRARCRRAGRAAFSLSLAFWTASSSIGGDRPAANAEDRESSDSQAEKPADFTSVSFSASDPTRWRAPEEVEVGADGSCIYRIGSRPAHGGEKGRPPAIQAFRLYAGGLRQLEDLLRKTDLLAIPRGGGSVPGLKDAVRFTCSISKRN